MEKKVKLSDIASRVGVSTVTVSKALSGQKGVSEGMRERIRIIADELGYKQPSVIRKEYSSLKSFQIGVLIREGYLEKYDSFYWTLYQNICTYALARDCFVLLEVITNEMEHSDDLPKLLREQKVSGIIIIGSPDPDYLRYLKNSTKVPVVFLDFTDGNSDMDAIVTDNYYGAYQITKYLIQQGHTDIGYVGTIRATGSITDRFYGYQKALLEANIPLNQEWLMEDREPGSGLISEDFFKLPERMPTAYFCNCDLTAGKLIQKLNQSGYRVPDDVSVIGFDNYIHPGICKLGITTYEVDHGEMVKLAVKLLINRISDPGTPFRTYVVGGHIVYKDSVKKIN